MCTQYMHRKVLINTYWHLTHAQPGTHGVGMLRCHVHTRKIQMSEILQKTRNNLYMTIYTRSICTEKSSYIDICIIHMHNRHSQYNICTEKRCMYMHRKEIYTYLHHTHAHPRIHSERMLRCHVHTRKILVSEMLQTTQKKLSVTTYRHSICTEKSSKKRYLHHTHAQQGTHGVGMLRCQIHTRKILMSEILQKTRNNLSMTIYRHCICTENSCKKRYLHHTHAQPDTHSVGTLRCHVHTRKILLSEILHKTQQNVSRTIYTHSICTEKT
jgi:hypothetical protein